MEGPVPSATSTISTTKTTDATGTVLRTMEVREFLYQPSAATKTDALSQVLIEELDPLMH